MAVAHRMYARALFQAALDQGSVDRVARELAELAELHEQLPAVPAFLRNPQIDPSEKAAVLEEIAADADPLVRNFLRLAAEKGRAGQLREIEAELAELVARHQNRLAVELTTAFELSDAEAASIVARIEDASGRTVDATRKVDPHLIGGIVLRVGSFRADGSVRGRLERLRHELVPSA